MPRPSTSRFSSITMALVVVEPRSMPMKQRMASSLGLFGSRGRRPRAPALLLDHLEIALQPVLDVGRREITRVHEIGLDEGGGLAGAPLDLAQHQKLAGGEAVAALDRVDQEAVRLVLVDVLLDETDPGRQVAVRVAAATILRERFERVVRIVAEAEIVDPAHLR